VQTTLQTAVRFRGAGLHSGHLVRLTVLPAPADHGIVFRRVDVAPDIAEIPATWRFAEPAQLCTRIRNKAGVHVDTIEHLMAALAGCGIHNALVEVDGPEVPILDGSAAPFVRSFVAAGIEGLGAPIRALRLLAPVEVRMGQAEARLDPAPGLQISFHIDFEDAAIGRQSKHLSMSNGSFVRELSDSRTFCRQRDVDAMHAAGLALGGTYENAVVVDGARVLSPGGLRHADEPVRHKMLDALGDLALAGMPLLARYTGVRAGHAVTGRLLETLFATPDIWRIVTLSGSETAMLPGAGVCARDVRLTA
jgi:UDP-3-O-[3-hydroxymyristoyl] N-acetylglucosamine deacetylase